jgi:molybdate transport system regulatory protein
MSSLSDPSPTLSVRIDFPAAHRLGPGKAALLAAIQDTQSISNAAKALGMSYPRALKLVDQLNQTFASSLVNAQHGGAGGGGASLTDTGQRVLELYNTIQNEAIAATHAARHALNQLTISPSQG